MKRLLLILIPCVCAHAASSITAIWANDGGDKVAREELRATRHVENLTGTVINRTWDGTNIKLYGARNETVSFDLVIEAATAAASGVSVQFDTLTGPGGAQIHSTATTGNGVFNWVNRPIELFYVRYLQIKGLSNFGWIASHQTYAENELPVRFRAPSTHLWADRPDHDKFYPEIMVPAELVPTFNVAAGQNQSIWSDIYIPKNTNPGTYTGTVVVNETGQPSRNIPVQLTIYSFTLPDQPSTPVMLYHEFNGINYAFVGTGFPNPDTLQPTRDKYHQLVRRHSASMIGDQYCNRDSPCDEDQTRILGTIFDSAHGYAGRGANLPMDIWSIGTYSSLTVSNTLFTSSQSAMNTHSNAWETWFAANAPNTDHFLYLWDEPSNSSAYSQIETWSTWLKNNPGVGKNLKSFSTLGATIAHTSTPDLFISCTWATVGLSTQAPDYNYFQQPGHNLYHYNFAQPAVGAHVIEADGIALRMVPWAQFKMGIKRWFYWIINSSGQNANTNQTIFTQAMSWPGPVPVNLDPTWGTVLNSDNSYNIGSNGEGVLVYPGTNFFDSANSYGVNGPFASMRLKEWRRGIQDGDYLAMARAVNPAATNTIIQATIPKVLWETGCPDSSCSFVTDVSGTSSMSWSSNPDVWESARASLASIIGGPPVPSARKRITVSTQ